MNAARAPRLLSLDVYRGAVMLFLASNALGLRDVPKDASSSPLYAALAHHVRHSPWAGCTAWDLIQPAFMFMVGLAMPYSYAARAAQGDDHRTQFRHAARRAAILVGLGVLLAAYGSLQLTFLFDNVLAQMGLGYLLAFFALGMSTRGRVAFVAAIIVAYWLLFALYPVTGTPGDHGAQFTGFFAHWNADTNAAAAFDRWFLNLFPQPAPILRTDGGYQTLSFLPAVANTVAGIVAADVLRSDRDARAKLRTLVIAGLVAILLGAALHFTACPMVKRIWTPSFAIFSTGWTVLFLAGLYWLIDLRGARRAVPIFIPVGMNSLAIYILIELVHPRFLERQRVLQDLVFTGLLWQFAKIMYDRKKFIRI